jgi:hypothetical protein
MCLVPLAFTMVAWALHDVLVFVFSKFVASFLPIILSSFYPNFLAYSACDRRKGGYVDMNTMDCILVFLLHTV